MIRKMKMFVTGIILCGGNSTRFGRDKILEKLLDKTVFETGLEVFLNNKNIDEIIVVAGSSNIEQVTEISKKHAKIKCVVPGGETRQQSVKNGVSQVSDNADFIAMHDGARAMITDAVINPVIEKTIEFGAATAAVPCKDTIKVADKTGKVISTPDRSTLFSVQTPQVFRKEIYLDAMKKAVGDYTDDCGLVEAAGYTVYLSAGSYENLKITTAEDIIIAREIMEGRR